MRVLLNIVAIGVILGDGLIALIAGVRLWRSRWKHSRPFAALFICTALHLLLLTTAILQLPFPRPANFALLILAAFAVLAIGIWWSSLTVLTSYRLFESSLWTVIEKLPDGLLIAEMKGDGKIIYANQQLQLISGYGHDELIGKSVETLVPIDKQSIHTQHRNEYRKEPITRPMGQGTFDLRTKDGGSVPVAISLSSHGDAYVIASVRREGA